MFLSKMAQETHGTGHLNTFALKYCAALFIMLGIGLFCVVTFTGESESTLGDNLNAYVTAHASTHEEEILHLEGKMDDLMDQNNTNYAASVVTNTITVKTFERMGVAQEFANLKRIIERSDEILPAIYYEDRDNAEIRLLALDMEIASLKEQM